MLLDDGRVVSNFIVQALKDEPLTIYGDGSQTRSFCYVDDLVRGFEAMMEKDGFIGPVNLGNPTEMTMLELADKVKEITGSKSEISHLPLPADDPTRRKPDISLAKSELGWSPEISVDDGLKMTIEDFSKRVRA